MDIEQVKVCDFRNLEGFRNFHIKNGLNVISGRNGSGKTTILQALKFILDPKYVPKTTAESLLNYSQTAEVQIKLKLHAMDKEFIISRSAKNIEFIEINGNPVSMKIFHEDFSRNYLKLPVLFLNKERITEMNGFLEKDFWRLLNKSINGDTEKQKEDDFAKFNDLHSEFKELQFEFHFLKHSVEKKQDFMNQIQVRNDLLNDYNSIKMLREIKIQKLLEKSTKDLRRNLDDEFEIYSQILEEYCEKKEECLKEFVQSSRPHCLENMDLYFINQDLMDTIDFKFLIKEIDFQSKNVFEVLKQLVEGYAENFLQINETKEVEKNSREFQMELILKRIANSNKRTEVLKEDLEHEKLSLQKLVIANRNELFAKREYFRTLFKDLENSVSKVIQLNYDIQIQAITDQLQGLEQKMKDIGTLSMELFLLKRTEMEYDVLLKEITSDMGYEEEILTGLFSVHKILNSEELKPESEREYIGTLYQIIEFKPGFEMMAQYYFGKILHQFYPYIFVKSARFASKLIEKFNEKQLPGEINIIPTEIYTTRAFNTPKFGICLEDFIEDRNPLKKFFEKSVIDFNDDQMTNDGIDPSFNGSNAIGNSNSMFTVKNLNMYLKIRQKMELLETEIQSTSSEISTKTEEWKEESLQILTTLQEISSSVCKNISEIVDINNVLNSEISSYFTLETFNFKGFETRLKVCEEALDLIEKEVFKLDYEQFEGVLQSLKNLTNSGKKTLKFSSCDENNILLSLKFSKTSLENLNFKSELLDSVMVKFNCGKIYDFDDSYDNHVNELECVKKTHNQALQQLITKRSRLYIMEKFVTRRAKKVRQDIIDEYGYFSIEELDNILKKFEIEAAVDPTKKDLTKLALNSCRVKKDFGKIRTQFQNNYINLGETLHNKALFDFSVPKMKHLLKILDNVKLFFKTVQPIHITELEVVCKLKNNSVNFINGVINFEDLDCAEFVFITHNGFLRFEDLSDCAKTVFYLALCYGIISQEEVKTLFLDDLGTIDHPLLAKIMDFFVTRGIQVILTSLKPWPENDGNEFSINNIAL